MKPAPKRVYLDLDRTLIDTERVMDALFAESERLYGLPAQKMRADMPQFTLNGPGGLRTYVFFEHIAAYGIDPSRAEHDIGVALAGRDFLFADVRPLLAFLATKPYDVSILTFGKARYQTFKYHLAPELQKIPITVIFEDKDQWLPRQSAIPSLLIDDKVVSPLPDWCQQLLIDRAAPQTIKKETTSLWRVNNLQNIETFVF